jgi:hypothetical protein
MISNYFCSKLEVMYRIGLLQRLPLQTPYPAVTSAIVAIMQRMPRGTTLVVDRTGAAGPYDELVAAGLSPVGVTMTGGEEINWSAGGNIVTVPKATLVSKLISLAHSGNLRVHGKLTDWPALRRELQNFRPERTPSGRETWNAAPGQHDDLLIATAICSWYLQGANKPGQNIFELYRRLAGGLSETYCVGVDFGKLVDPTAICGMVRLDLPEPQPDAEFVSTAPVEAGQIEK